MVDRMDETRTDAEYHTSRVITFTALRNVHYFLLLPCPESPRLATATAVIAGIRTDIQPAQLLPNTRARIELTQTFRYTLDFFFVRWLRQPRVPIAASLCPAIADEADVCIRKCQAIETAFPVATYIEKGFQASPIHLLSSLETAASFAGGHPLPESGDTVS